MTKRKLVSAAMIVAAVLASPAMAREGHVARRHPAVNANATCIPAPAVGAFATQPWDNGPPCEPTMAY